MVVYIFLIITCFLCHPIKLIRPVIQISSLTYKVIPYKERHSYDDDVCLGVDNLTYIIGILKIYMNILMVYN